MYSGRLEALRQRIRARKNADAPLSSTTAGEDKVGTLLRTARPRRASGSPERQSPRNHTSLERILGDAKPDARSESQVVKNCKRERAELITEGESENAWTREQRAKISRVVARMAARQGREPEALEPIADSKTAQLEKERDTVFRTHVEYLSDSSSATPCDDRSLIIRVAAVSGNSLCFVKAKANWTIEELISAIQQHIDCTMFERHHLVLQGQLLSRSSIVGTVLSGKAPMVYLVRETISLGDFLADVDASEIASDEEMPFEEDLPWGGYEEDFPDEDFPVVTPHFSTD